VVIGGCVEYDVSDGQDEKSGCRVLFIGQGINFGGISDSCARFHAPISDE
jgi:hypothetical protein